MTSYDTAELRSLGHQVYDAINAQDLAALEQLFAPDVVRHAMGQVGFDAASPRRPARTSTGWPPPKPSGWLRRH